MPYAMKNRCSTQTPAEEFRPRGSVKTAEKAVAYLGPFDEQVERQAPWNNEPTRCTARLARELVDALAESFLIDEYMNRNAPRRSEVARELIEFKDSIETLFARLQSLDDFTLIQLHRTAGNPLRLPIDHIVKEADVADLPLPGQHDRNSSQWVRSLGALAILARHSLQAYSQGSTVVDKGGDTNAYTSEWGSSRCALVSRGWIIFDFFKPGQAKGTEYGPFHEFLNKVFQYATGMNGEKHAKLIFWIKRLCKKNNRGCKLRQRFEELEAERKTLSKYLEPSERLLEIWAEQDAISDEHLALLRRAPPFA
jgi:hypothetical protein